MSREVPAVVDRYFAAANAHDPQAMAACWRQGGVEVIPALGLALRAPDDLAAHFRNLFDAIPDVSFRIEQTTTDGEVVAVRSVMGGTHQGRYNGIAGTGKRFAIDVVDFLSVEDGQIVSNHVVVDAMSTARQLGLLPGLGSRTETALQTTFNALQRLRRPPEA